MKRILLPLLVWSTWVAPAWANKDLAKAKNCLSCHEIDRKVVGPAYKDIATKYAGQNAVSKLTTKVMKGGSGAWGVIPMPANPQVSQAEAETLVKWVLSLK